MGVPTGNVRPKMFSTGSAPAGSAPLPLGPITGNAVYCLTDWVVATDSPVDGDSAMIQMNGGVIVLATVNFAFTGGNPHPGIDRHVGCITVEEFDGITVYPSAAGTTWWAIGGSFWCPDVDQ